MRTKMNQKTKPTRLLKALDISPNKDFDKEFNDMKLSSKRFSSMFWFMFVVIGILGLTTGGVLIWAIIRLVTRYT